MSNKDKKKGSKKNGKKTKSSAKAKEREAKRAARKGDGSFPDMLIVTKEKDKDGGKSWFLGHEGELNTLYKNGQGVAVYKLRKVSSIEIKRKVVR